MIRKFLWHLKGIFEDMSHGYTYEGNKRYFIGENGERKLDENYHRPN